MMVCGRMAVLLALFLSILPLTVVGLSTAPNKRKSASLGGLQIQLPSATNHHHINRQYQSVKAQKFFRKPSSSTTIFSSSNSNSNESPSAPSPSPSKTSIAIIGSGAVGCYYGGRLWETQQYDVRFHMRGEHLSVSREKGLLVESIEGDMFIPPEEDVFYGDVKEMGKVDWVLLCLKSTALTAAGDGDGDGGDAIRSLVLPLLTQDTRVLVIMNGMVDDDVVRILEGQQHQTTTPISPSTTDDGVTAESIPSLDCNNTPKLTVCAATYGGMAFLCSNRIAPGHIQHSYAGKLTSSLASSSLTDDDSGGIACSQHHQKEIEDLFRPTRGFEFCYDDNIVRARWSKNLWNLPFNGISVAMGGVTVDRVVGDEGLRRLAYLVMDETVAVCNEDLRVRGYSEEYFLGQAEKDQMMYLSDNMGPYSTSTMLDLVNRRPMEVHYLFRKALERANQLSVSVPTLNTLIALIGSHQNYYKLF